MSNGDFDEGLDETDYHVPFMTNKVNFKWKRRLEESKNDLYIGDQLSSMNNNSANNALMLLNPADLIQNKLQLSKHSNNSLVNNHNRMNS